MKFIVKMAWALLSIVQKIERSRSIGISITGNPNFPSPNPTVATVTTATNQLEAAALKARTGTKSDTTAMHDKEDALDMLMKQLATYVEGIANQNPLTAEAVIQSAGMDVVRRANRSVPLFEAVATGKPGEIRLQRKGVKRGTYEFQMSTDITKEENFETINRGTQSRFLVTDLAPGKWYYFRARAITPEGTGEWSDVKEVYLIK
jgi:hypothetical protein